ncbi:MAG: hypothetical protein M3P51_00885 [Chloroflexota bacterium]|nr:hypothetical protein [Chloroflexota bacterium]
MIENIRVTLYDIFGFFVPGAVLLGAILIALWAIFLPGLPLGSLDVTTWTSVLFAILAYVAGHLSQAIGNQLQRFSSSREERTLEGCGDGALPESMVNAARQKAADLVGVRAETLNSRWLFRICNTAIAQRGDYGDRDVYIYREGFYRGLAVAFLVLSASLLLRAARPGAALDIAGSVRSVDWTVWLFLAALTLGTSWLMFKRFQRFADYSVTHAVISFLTLHEGQEPPHR